jgi:hypothetical protein
MLAVLAVLAAALVIVPVLWFVLVLVLWALAGGDAPSPGGHG